MESVAHPGQPSLMQLAATLRQRLGTGSLFQLLNTRLVIQHGVNLKDISPDQDRDPALLARVRSTLSRMGIALEGGRP